MPITLDGTNGITTPTYGGADTSEYLVPVTQFKNRIINGGMVIDQRNNGAVATTGYAVDRFEFQDSTAASFDIQRSTTAPSEFLNSVIITVTVAGSATAAQVCRFFQRIEGNNIADLRWGTASAKTVTLSFWVRSSITGTYCIGLVNGAFNRSYVAEYTISSANTWEYKTITVAGDTSGTWETGTSTGIQVTFDLGSGSNFNATAGSWGAVNAFRTTNQTNFANNNGATFYITGVQLEVGSTATSFDYRPFGTELALCQRYCYVWGGDSPYELISLGCADSVGRGEGLLNFAVTMRASPTATFTSTPSQFRVLVNGSTSIACTSLEAGNISRNSLRVIGYVASGIAIGNITQIGANNSTSPRIFVSAEL